MRDQPDDLATLAGQLDQVWGVGPIRIQPLGVAARHLQHLGLDVAVQHQDIGGAEGAERAQGEQVGRPLLLR